MELFTAVSQLYLLLHFTQNQTVTMHGETYSIPHSTALIFVLTEQIFVLTEQRSTLTEQRSTRTTVGRRVRKAIKAVVSRPMTMDAPFQPSPSIPGAQLAAYRCNQSIFKLQSRITTAHRTPC